ncbi:MAG: alkaline phosphatase family protein, partial [Spongiibacteraceae bacterium]
LALLGCVDGSSSNSNTASVSEVSAGRVLSIGMDGTRAEALDLANTPHLDALRAVGVEDMNAITGDVSLSGPGWASMLTGVWCDKHGVIDNDVSWALSRFEQYPHFIQYAKAQRADLRAVSVSHWAAINDEILCADENSTECSAADQVITVASDAAVRDAVVQELESQDPSIIFLQFDDIDHAGHGDPATLDIGGFCPYANGDMVDGEHNGGCTLLNHNPAYLAAIATTDGYIGDILQALYARPAFETENWLIMVSPDHGGAGVVFNQHGFSADQDRRTFLIMAGEAISSFPDNVRSKIVDIAATALFHLGINVPETANLDGQAIALRGALPYTEQEIPTCFDPAIFAPDSGSGR